MRRCETGEIAGPCAAERGSGEKFLCQFHEEEKIGQTQQARRAERAGNIPEECCAHRLAPVNRDVVGELGRRYRAEDRNPEVDATVIGNWK